MKKNFIVSVVVRFFLSLFVLSVSFVIFVFLYTGFPREIYEKSLIEKVFRENKNIRSIDKMVSQKDFSACFDVYFTTTTKKKFIVTNVQIKNKEIVFVGFYRTNENFDWLETLDVGENLYDNLFPLLNNLNDY